MKLPEMQIYAVALYVEADKAKAELQRLRAEGFFAKGYSDDRVMEALVAGRSGQVEQSAHSAQCSRLEGNVPPARGLDICDVSTGMKRVREAHAMQVQEAAADPDAAERVR